MKILLVNSPWINTPTEYGIKAGTRWAALRKNDRSMPYFPFPYSLASATAVLKISGIDAHVKDMIAEEMSRQESLAYIQGIKPSVIVSEAFTPSIEEDLAFMKDAKERTGSVSIFCGAHATALPHDILRNDFMDFVIMGEIDYTLRELIRYLEKGRQDFENIKGLAYKKNGEIITNRPREDIADLDELPLPEYEELPMVKYTEPFSQHYPNAKIVTSRGCPYRCIFCIEPLMHTSVYRKRSTNAVIKEMKYLSERYAIKEFFFDDAIFTVSRALEIARAILSSGLKTYWSCWIDWSITEEQLALLKRSGCVGVKFGIESVHSEILKTAKKPVSISRIKKMIASCRRLGLLRHATYMFGLPGETRETLRQSLDFLFSLDLTSSQVTIATPLPGTEFYRMAKENGWLTSTEWSQYESLCHAVLRYPQCNPEDLLAAIEAARRQKVKQMLKNPWLAMRYVGKLYRIHGGRKFFLELSQKCLFVIKAFKTR